MTDRGTMVAARSRAGGRGSWLRIAVWALHVALPALGLWLVLAQPALDARWEDHAAHFWLVLAVAVIALVLGLRVSQNARLRGDARLALIGLAFVGSAGFFALHALATPGILLEGPNAGFELATPVGMLVATGFAAASAVELSPDGAQRVTDRQRLLLTILVAAMSVWAVLSLAGLPPLGDPLTGDQRRGPLLVIAGVGVLLLGWTAARYWAVHRRRPSVMLLSLVTAFVLLAEAMVATVYARNWQVSWWTWHVLLVFAFGFVLYAARVQQRREGTPVGLFDAVALEQTVRKIREEYGAALETLVEAMEHRAASGAEESLRGATAQLAVHFDLTERQLDVLERAAEALLHERQQQRRLAGLVAIGREASVIVQEPDLLGRAVAIARDAFAGDRLDLGLLRDGVLTPVDGEPSTADPTVRQRALETLEPVEVATPTGTVLALPLVVKGHPTGVLEVRRTTGSFADRDRALLGSLVSQLAIAIENTRLYREVADLFRSYLSPHVATALLADPQQARLGGAIREVTVLMADLRGYTPFSERSQPDQIVAMLNVYYSAVVPVILDQGGTVTQFIGDAVMAMFNAPASQPDHALRAAHAGLGMQATIAKAAAGHPDWPRFRVGINTGPALVGNIGSAELRNYTAIGDTINLAARLEGTAEVGDVVVGQTTWEAIRDKAEGEALGPLVVKGKVEPVEAYRLIALRE